MSSVLQQPGWDLSDMASILLDMFRFISGVVAPCLWALSLNIPSHPLWPKRLT
jgi:hypothetical protein